MPVGGTLTQAYTDSSGYKPFAIKAVCSDGSVYECYSLQYVHVSNGIGARFVAGNILPLGGNFSNTAPTPHNGTMQVIYSTKRPVGHPQHKQLVKPLIIINGLDETDVDPNTPASQKKNLRSLLNDWNALSQFYDFNGQLDDVAGYDLIYINYYTLDKIEHNAEMLISMINWINANKAAGAEQNVVMGIELGGLIARYALAQMTKAGTQTQTRLLITHDAPHQGAYMPLGYQHLAEDLGEMDYWGTPFRSMISEFKTRDKLKNSPVFAQFYLHKVDGATVSYNSFLAPNGPYQTMVTGFTPSYQFVATSQGSQCGSQITQPGITMLDYEQKIEDDPAALIPNIKLGSFCILYLPVAPVCIVKVKFTLGFGIGYKIKLKVNALPAVGTNNNISYAAMTREIYLKLKTKICDGTGNICVTLDFLTIKIGTGAVYSQGPFERKNPTNILPFESFAGSTNSLKNFNFRLITINPVPITIMSYYNVVYPSSKFFDISFQNPTYSYISRVSALDIANPVAADYTQPLIQPLNGLNRSRAAKYVCQEATSVGGATLFNLASGRFTKRNAQWMFKTMENQNTITEDCVGYADCYNINNSTIVGENVVCSSKPFSISNLPPIANVAWSTMPSYANNLNCTNCTTTNLTKVNDETVILNANITTACNSTGLQITKTVYTGKPIAPNPHIILGQAMPFIPNQPTRWSFAALYFPYANYSWYRDDAREVELSNTDPNNPNTLNLLIPCSTSFKVQCKISNECGSTAISLPIQTAIGYCPPKRGTRFNPFVSILQHDQLKVNTATTNNWLAQLFFDEATIANEMIQRVHIYNKRGELMMEDNELNTKNATIDIAALPQDSYVIEVEGLNGYKELHTFHRSLLNQEQYQIEDIATGNIAMNVDFAEERLYVMQQKLFVELQSEPDIMNASSILQEFASTNANSSLGIIYQIEYALGNNNVDEATTLLDHWQTTNDIDNNFKNYYALYLRVIQGGTLNTDEVATLYNIAQSCPLVAGEIVYAARSLHNNLVNDNDDYANACGYIGAKYTTKPTKLNQYLNAETSISPNPTKGIITIKLPAKDTGFKTIKITDAYGKIIAERKTFDRVLMMDLKAPTGIYFVNITNAVTGKTETQKLIINN